MCVWGSSRDLIRIRRILRVRSEEACLRSSCRDDQQLRTQDALDQVEVTNHSCIQDLDISVRGHLAVVGANDVGKSSPLRLLHLTLGSSTAQLYSSLTTDDLRNEAPPLAVRVAFGEFSDDERRILDREIDIHPVDKTESLEIRLEVAVDSEDDEAVLINRWYPGRGEVRALTRGQPKAVGWRHLSAAAGPSRPSSTDQTARSGILGAVDEKSSFGDLLGDQKTNSRIAPP